MKKLVYQSVTEMIGDTPAVRLNRLTGPGDAEVLVKLERFNPSGSVKDRAASSLIEDAETRGLIGPGSLIVEPTSGNTGIGLAMNAAARGYRLILVMPDNMSKERIDLLKAYGAEVVLTPASQRMPGAIREARSIAAATPGSFMPNQFDNAANPDVHRRTTALEILEQTDGRLDAFVATAGTGGTITGTGETLKERLPNIYVAVVEPAGSPVLSGGVPGPHKLVGTSPGFVPSILNTDVYDEIVQVTDEDAIGTMKRLAREEGILAGPSSGASVWAALQLARKLGVGKRVLCIAPDTGERYLSMDLF
ncbi:cysteine synthase A [Cohnella rhizosphaerae]|uniref:Cysteine synthase n=1 Tax=Cohnella rhizosphaerae TaxID=1457232 RepID=A0A9X4QRX6_9BACL|nr:cysteine synthase A [Cohnella rhizosphaerae]MDG0808738.1 cysteine synthase A [Cohnella rhizosphaerae]